MTGRAMLKYNWREMLVESNRFRSFEPTAGADQENERVTNSLPGKPSWLRRVWLCRAAHATG
jgi:hypothetical protein